jgi:predicted DCC family thiol-disulfide oxidoreductase YuxK
VNTEITETLLYDANCGLCSRWAARVAPILRRRGVAVAPLPAASDEMKLRLVSGEELGGADAAVSLARRVWWAWPVWLLSRLPGIMPGLRRGYRWIAAHRSCVRGSCVAGRARRGAPTRWILPVALFGGALLTRPVLPAWGFMWAMAAALVAGAMGASGWRPRFGWSRAGVWNVMAGAILFWGVARFVPVGQGWAGMVGLVLMLHFGLVQCVTPIMNAPLRARSVSEFWGRRWNRAFSEMMRPLVFEPVATRWGAKAAMFAVFGVSGILHELVISLPAGGGYGLPTGYFLIQAFGLRVRSRVLTWVVVAGPVYWLFHPPFVERVIKPMMEALGAL